MPASHALLFKFLQSNISKFDLHDFSYVQLQADLSLEQFLFVVIHKINGNFTIQLVHEVIALAEDLYCEECGCSSPKDFFDRVSHFFGIKVGIIGFCGTGSGCLFLGISYSILFQLGIE